MTGILQKYRSDYSLMLFLKRQSFFKSYINVYMAFMIGNFRTKSRHYVFLPLKKIFSFFNDAILKERNTKNTVELQPIKLIYKCKISLISKMVWKTPSWVLVIFQWVSANHYVQCFFYIWGAHEMYPFIAMLKMTVNCQKYFLSVYIVLIARTMVFVYCFIWF